MPELETELGFPARNEEEEEQRWLEALERGELDDNGELKKEVDESLLTARQASRREEPRGQVRWVGSARDAFLGLVGLDSHDCALFECVSSLELVLLSLQQPYGVVEVEKELPTFGYP